MCKRLLCLTCCILVLGLATVESADLFVHYKLDEASGTVAADASGNGFDGIINGSTNWVDGTMGGALELTGSCNVTLPADVMGLTSVIGSVAFWMNADVPTGINTMFWAGDNTTGGGFGPENEMHVHLESAVADIWIGGELSFFAIADPNVHLHSDPAKGEEPGIPPVSPILLGDLNWHHAAATWDGDNGSMKLFVDGLLVMEKVYSFKPYDLTNIFLGQMGGGNRTYVGKLDDVRIYSNALSDEEVLFIYENQDVYVNDSPAAKPQEFVLNQNYPNPFNPTTTLSYQLAKNSDVLLTIYNQTGQKVRTLVQEKQGSGFQSINWDGRDDAGQQSSSGIYLYRLQVDNQVQTRKLMLVKQIVSERKLLIRNFAVIARRFLRQAQDKFCRSNLLKSKGIASLQQSSQGGILSHLSIFPLQNAEERIYLMPDYRRAFALGGTFLFTVVKFDRRPLLTSDLSRRMQRRAWEIVQINSI